jgi:hypothetical protein
MGGEFCGPGVTIVLVDSVTDVIVGGIERQRAPPESPRWCSLSTLKFSLQLTFLR